MITPRWGPKLLLEVGPALGLTDEETETVSWLVLHHLLLSATAFKRDIDDPKDDPGPCRHDSIA